MRDGEVLDVTTNTLKVAGSDAVYFQTYVKIDTDVSEMTGKQKPTAGDTVVLKLASTSSTPLCYDHFLSEP
jgi:hypothetical protein